MDILYTAGGTVQTIALDASIQESPVHAAVATEHPVEKGEAVTDHVRPQATRITVDAIVTNAPIAQPRSHARGALGSVQPVSGGQGNVLQFQGGRMDRVRDVYEEIVGLIEGGVLVTIVTSLHTFDQMVLENMSPKRSAEVGDALRFTFDARHIRIVESQLVAAPAPAVARKKRGHQSAKETDPVKDAPTRSFASQLFDSFKGTGARGQ